MIIWSLLRQGVLTAHHPVIEQTAHGLRLRKDELIAMYEHGRGPKHRVRHRPLGSARVLAGADGYDYLTPHEAAKLLHVSLATIWRWLRVGAIEGYHPVVIAPTRSKRVRRADLDALPADMLHMPSRARDRIAA
jgi:excisionase family DNA binding protein